MSYEIKVYSKPDGQLKKYWQELEINSFCYCYQSYDWFENWVNNFRNFEKDITCIVVVSYNKKILFILPLEIIKKFNLRILQWIGGKHSDYLAPILSKNFDLAKEDFADLWKNIKLKLPHFDLIYLIKQPKTIDKLDNPFVLFLNNYVNSNTYNIILPKTWNEYNQTVLKKKFRTQNIRSKKLLKKLGNLKFKILTDRTEKIEIIKELIIQKNLKLRSLGAAELLENKDLNFYTSFENRKLDTITTHISYLKLNEKIIAIHWGLLYKKRFYYLLPSMNEKNLSKYSPGRLLLSLLIRWSISKRFEIFDFTLGDESYKKSWTNNGDQLFSYLYLNNFKGIVLYILIKSRLMVKSIDRYHYIKKLVLLFKKIFKV
tara:strand:+ start:624 stop:1742 length:1119 start_codon:yes stop_codon:yes gene_type:complete